MGGDDLRLGRQPQAWQKVMAAYRRVDGLSHLYTGISSGPNARKREWENLPFIFCQCVQQTDRSQCYIYSNKPHLRLLLGTEAK